MTSQAYCIVKTGTYPNETYSVGVSASVINPDLGVLSADNFLRFVNNQIIPISYLQNVNYLNTSVGGDNLGIYNINTQPNTTIVWNVSSERRSYNIGNTFNSFSITTGKVLDKTFINNVSSTNYTLNCYNYLLYPNRLVLAPTSKPTFNGTNWSITTQTLMLSQQTFFYNSSSTTYDAATQNYAYARKIPPTEALPVNTNYSLFFNVCACRTRVNNPVFTFTDSYNPAYFSTILENTPSTVDKCTIRPYSTFVTYDISYYAMNESLVYKTWTLGQQRPDITTGLDNTFKSSYILNYTPPSTKQTFQLLQIKNDNTTLDLGDPYYCTLSAIFDLGTSNFKYTAKSFQLANQTIISTVTGRSGTPISVSYIADCPTMQFSLERWQDTIYSVSAPLGSPLSTNTGTVTWNTKYPPHYYSFKASISGNSEKTQPNTQFLETSDLTWFLYSSALSAGYTTGNYTTSVTLSTFFTSNFNFIQYDLSAASNDFIKFTPVVGNNSTVFLSSLSCYYGDNLNALYSLNDTPWIPANKANKFMITYPVLKHGQLNFSLRPTLCSIAGYIDGWDATPILLAKGQLPINPGLPIFMTKVRENEDFMEVDSSFLTSASSWPSRDLTNSLISWDFYPVNQTISINSVDLSGNYIQQIPRLSSVVFNNKTWSVVISGYGPQTTTLILSSQKYNETTTLSSVSDLFNYFREGKIVVGAIPNTFDNLDQIRNISLTARVPYKDRQYDLPLNSPISWTWTYDNDIDYENVPVSAYNPNISSIYNYGDTTSAYAASSIKFNILPPNTLQIPSVHEVIFNAAIDTYAGLLQKSYTVYVDDFPDPSIFNTNFGINYSSLPSVSAQILNTSNNKYVVTRPNIGNNNFILTINPDTTQYLNTKSIVWNVNNTLTYGTTSLNITLNSVGVTNVVLSGVNTLAPGWTSAHNIDTQVTFYILDPMDFYTPLEFNVLPEYFWLGGGALTLTTQNNYTLASAPTAYGNKKSNSQAFYLSANKSYFNDYRYFVGNTTEIGSANSYYQLLEIPYNNDLTISLTAFNDTFFPAYNGLYYATPLNGNLQNLPFNIVSKTSTSPSKPFEATPSIIPYNTTTVSFTSNLTSINLDSQRVLTIFQQISTNPIESPSQVQSGTITYTLSTAQWQVNKLVPAITGQYDIFEVSIGDPSVELTLSGNFNNSLFLTASASVDVKIPTSTFRNYTDSFGIETDFFGDRDLWNLKNQNLIANGSLQLNAFSPSSKPQVYLSTTYTLTGVPLLLQFKTPYISDSFEIIAYAVDFGEKPNPLITSAEIPINYIYQNKGTFFISYSAVYNDGSIEQFQHPNPIFVYDAWKTYNPNELRFVEETYLTLPYNADQINIQPNEWGDADIFNTAISRLQANLDYVKGNVQTIDTTTPTVFFGWMGCNGSNIGEGIRWYTKDYVPEYHTSPSNAVLNGFSNILDVANSSDHIFVLDGTKFRAFSANNNATEIFLNGVSDLDAVFLNPISLEVDETGTVIYVADPPKNKIYRFDLELYTNKPTLNYTLNVGGLGGINDTGKFNSPSEIVYSNQRLFVLDYNNKCVKKYNKNLNWIHTYYDIKFETDIPTNIAVHPELNFLYIITESKTIYVFDPFATDYFSSFIISNLSGHQIVKVIFDEAGEFIYITTTTGIYKYSVNGYFIGEMNMFNNVGYTTAKNSSNRSLLFATKNAIIKVQDILNIYKVGDGYPAQYWTLDQLLLDRDELAMDRNYNRSIVRMGQNVKTFRNSLNAKLVLATEQTSSGLITYFSMAPIAISERPVFDIYLEKDFVGVGVNELHTPQTLNKELIKLYDAVYLLKGFMDITSYNITSQGSSNCNEKFCWSWSAMSCYNLTLPSIRVCNINPITYAELETNFPVSYAPTKTWGEATSDCCNKVIPPV